MPFVRRYTAANRDVLTKVERDYGQSSEPVMFVVLRRMYPVHNDVWSLAKSHTA